MAEIATKPHVPPGTLSPDPLARVLSLGDGSLRDGVILGVLIAFLSHGAAFGKAMTSLVEMRQFVEVTRTSLHEYFWAVYEVDNTPKPKVEEKAPDPVPDPTPAPPPDPKAFAPKPKDDPYEQQAPAAKPSEASKVLTDDKPVKDDEPLDMTKWGIVSGNGTALGGQQSAAGSGNTITHNPHTSLTGTPGGTGSGPPPPPPPPAPTVDRSAPPSLVGSTQWNCPFPAEADTDEINDAVVTIVVTVRPDGTPAAVSVASDPGHGFARQARICALSKKYQPGLDKLGSPTTSSTPPLKVRFTR
jgi:protein TonB